MIDKRLTEIWKEKMIESLNVLYKDKNLSKEFIEKIVKNIFNKKYKPAIGVYRNIYKMTKGENDVNIICEELNNDKSIISANGSIFYNYDIEPSPVLDVLNIKMEERKKFKNLMLEMTELGNVREEKNYDRLQYNKKAFSNSIYGNFTMSVGFLSNCDVGSSITLQARQLNSEMLWDIERFISGNIAIYNTNELIQYITHILNKPFKNTKLINDIEYIPTIEDCKDHLNSIVHEMNGLNEFYNSNLYCRLLTRIESFSEIERIKFYYKDNLLSFIEKNNVLFNRLFTKILENTEKFLNPYKIPDSYIEDLEILWEYCDNFVFSEILTYKRVDKYLYRSRKSILISDTDSIFICLDELMSMIINITNNRFNYKFDENIRFKLVNSITYLLGNVCDVMCVRLSDASHVDKRERERLRMKNEFFFRRMILFPGVKKNYVTLCVLREGRIIPEKNTLQITGMKLTSSNIKEEIKDRINFIIKEYLLKPLEINPIEVWKQVIDLKQFITNELLNGNKKYALYAKYKGMIENYKDPTRIELIRAVTLWNRLYENNEIGEGVSVYKIKTNLKTELDVEKYIKDPIIKEKIYDVVFDKYGKHRRDYKDLDFYKYGLSTLAIPSDDSTKIPEWIIPAMDIEYIIDMHLRSLLDLLSGIGLHRSKLTSQRKRIDTLVNF